MSSLSDDETKKAVLSLAVEGLSIRKISTKLNLSRTAVTKFLRKQTYTYWWKQYEKEQKSKTIKTNPCFKKDNGTEDNSRILCISDMHIPYCHDKTLEFLEGLKKKYSPTRIICLGDEVDKHSLSYHDHDPDLFSAGHELEKSKKFIKELYGMFPEIDILESNHGSLVWRKAKTHGIPRAYIKSYNEVLEVSEKWKWWFDLTITLPDGNKCYFHHGKLSDVLRLSQQMGMSAVQGHYHEKFKIDYWANPNGIYFGMQIGCLINDDSYAFAYNNINVKRPIIGTGLIIDSKPILEPMRL